MERWSESHDSDADDQDSEYREEANHASHTVMDRMHVPNSCLNADIRTDEPDVISGRLPRVITACTSRQRKQYSRAHRKGIAYVVHFQQLPPQHLQSPKAKGANPLTGTLRCT
jgi:hypothetical protein